MSTNDLRCFLLYKTFKKMGNPIKNEDQIKTNSNATKIFKTYSYVQDL